MGGGGWGSDRWSPSQAQTTAGCRTSSRRFMLSTVSQGAHTSSCTPPDRSRTTKVTPAGVAGALGSPGVVEWPEAGGTGVTRRLPPSADHGDAAVAVKGDEAEWESTGAVAEAPDPAPAAPPAPPPAPAPPSGRALALPPPLSSPAALPGRGSTVPPPCSTTITAANTTHRAHQSCTRTQCQIYHDGQRVRDLAWALGHWA
jgi:hypothetical protein